MGRMRVGGGSRPVVILQRAKLFHLRIALVRGDAEHSGFQFAVNGEVTSEAVTKFIHQFFCSNEVFEEYRLTVNH